MFLLQRALVQLEMDRSCIVTDFDREKEISSRLARTLGLATSWAPVVVARSRRKVQEASFIVIVIIISREVFAGLCKRM
jgi:hypothetical protein